MAESDHFAFVQNPQEDLQNGLSVDAAIVSDRENECREETPEECCFYCYGLPVSRLKEYLSWVYPTVAKTPCLAPNSRFGLIIHDFRLFNNSSFDFKSFDNSLIISSTLACASIILFSSSFSVS